MAAAGGVLDDALGTSDEPVGGSGKLDETVFDWKLGRPSGTGAADGGSVTAGLCVDDASPTSYPILELAGVGAEVGL